MGFVSALDVAQQYIADTFASREFRRPDIRYPNLDDGFSARVAMKLDALENAQEDPHVRSLYLRFREETRCQYDAMTAAGIEVLPWLRPGQPYSTAAELCEKVSATGVIHVYLTESGYGPGEERDARNPMLDESDVEIDGFRFLYNDLFRAVHDYFGHSMYGDSFTLRGELRAAYNHFSMYSEAVYPALFNELVAQICWFYSGPHLMTGDGVIPQAAQPGWIPPRERPYSPQKIVLFPQAFAADFLSRFGPAPASTVEV